MSSPQLFDPDPLVRDYAMKLFEEVEDLPLISPHGHVSPVLFADENYRFGSPAELLVTPDHYVTRMLYAYGIKLEALGVPSKIGAMVEQDHHKIWQRFADHFFLFRGTPSGLWIQNELREVFHIEEKLDGENAQAIYDQIDEQIKSPEFSPRKLYEQFNLEVLCTTDAASDQLVYHQQILDSEWQGRILPTFRPDSVINLGNPNWHLEIRKLSEVSGIEIKDYDSYITTLENRRAYFKQMGAKATDHAALYANTQPLSHTDAGQIFDRAMTHKLARGDVERFTAHMLYEMARMSVEDGLIMQLHVGSYRNHNKALYEGFGPDIGADMPVRTELTRALAPLLNAFGSNPKLTLIVFNLDESTYARELAPLAGHYPALKIGPPWWFHDSPNGIARYLDQVIETAGVYNTVGFNDDTRAFLSIPARHEVWRRVSCNWVAGLWARKIIDQADARVMAHAFAYDLAKQAYKL
jgi:glucuronate isomerase